MIKINSPWLLLSAALVTLCVAAWALIDYRKANQTWSQRTGAVPGTAARDKPKESSAYREREALKRKLEAADQESAHQHDRKQAAIVLEKSTNYPPVTEKETEMWAWWDSMSRSGEGFKYRRPIRFYGRVVDERGKAVPKALITVSIKKANGNHETRFKSDDSGRFKVEGQHGKYICVWVEKEGYQRGTRAFGTFEYAEFFSDRFHSPDPNQPVEFALLDPGSPYR